ncbi:SusC/RagA family TonB-linked outer membrane protein [Chitinophaga sp. GCM10012297]|uniref:TonB-dependent receptor n=1 Tax=Chitinophaga chungangae TaxID=2821488 RepID=A0ABS3YJH1_9BACT|nr:TonB-dependent receptor [Chitinophaga chungangae]MBO9154448.1 TonB-dependent receptor [Chitinophaga chungangae]
MKNRLAAFIFSLLVIAGCGQALAAARGTLPANAAPVADITVKGTVSEKSGKVPGVTVLIEGSNKHTITDENGNYAITVPANGVLVFSIVGYKTQRIPVNSRERIDVTMAEEVRGLDEVVIKGYTSQTRANLTSAISTVSGDELKQTATSNLTNALAGRVTGVLATTQSGRPGTGAWIQIRGRSSVNEPGPLILVDGVVREDFGNIDANDVASISILKDASATAVYGARAVGGVILVTTKRGQIGKPSISYSASTGIERPTKYPDMMTAYEYGTARNQAQLNAGFDPSNPSQASKFFTAEQLESFKTNSTDWFRETFKGNSTLSQHNLSVNGGTEAVSYFASLGYTDQQGMWDQYNYQRYNLRSNVDARISNTLKVGLNIDASRANTNAAGLDAYPIFMHAIQAAPIYRPYNTSGQFNYLNGQPNPVAETSETGYDRNRIETFGATLNAEQKLDVITTGLSLKGTVSIIRNSTFHKVFNTPYMVYKDNGEASLINVNNLNKTQLDQNVSEANQLTVNASLNYARQFGRHNVSAVALYEQLENKGFMMGGLKRDFVSSIKDELNASGPLEQSLSGTSTIGDARRSFVGILNYSYDNRYLLEASARRDGSYRFAESQRWGLFPAVSAGWRISEESFFKETKAFDFIDNLKLRASVGETGNDKISSFQFMDSYTYMQGKYPNIWPDFFPPVIENESQINLVSGVFPNYNLTWEKLVSKNIGLDATLFNNHVGIEADYFFRTTRDMLRPRILSTPATFGRRLPDENYAEMKSKGVEVTLSYRGNVNSFGYNFRVNFSYATNKLTRLDVPEGIADYQNSLGRPLNAMVGYVDMGLFQNQKEVDDWVNQFGSKPSVGDIRYADISGDGEVTEADQTQISNNSGAPLMVFGFSSELRWKNFDANIFFQGAGKRTIMLGEEAMVFFRAEVNNSFAYLNDYWTPENPGAKYPRPTIDYSNNNSRGSTFWMRDGAYLRLKSVNLGYSFGTLPWMRKRGMKLRVYAAGANLLTWSPFKEFDPELGDGTGRSYPQQRNLSLGLNFSF